MKDKERLRNCQKLEKTKETSQLNAVRNPGMGPEIGQRH